MREERDDNPFSWYRWQYDSAGRLLVQDDTLPGQEQMRWEGANSAWKKCCREAGRSYQDILRTYVCRGNTWTVR
ncbi:hypothetical protein A3N37_08750 [Enterobacter ludwigii]|nr:hypothetical protein A3N37_08750 [Enterobacter ludwigii]